MLPQVGDIYGFRGAGCLSATIAMGTGGWLWGVSHVGIVGEYNGEKLLFEATTLSDLPCIVQGKPVKGTQAHPIADRVASYQGRIWHYPLVTPLWNDQYTRLNQFLLEHIGHDYDAWAALFAADVMPSFIESWLHPEREDAFCSEFCFTAHATIGKFTDGDAGSWSPTRLVRAERRRGILRPPIKVK